VNELARAFPDTSRFNSNEKIVIKKSYITGDFLTFQNLSESIAGGYT